MSSLPDIDIDFPVNFKPETLFPNWVKASQVKNDELVAHPCGIHPQTIPVDSLTGLSAIPYQQAEELGYAKIDFLHLQLLGHFTSREEIEQLLDLEPDWGLLLIPEHQVKLFQLSKHGDVLSSVKPKSVLELADVLALIRPGKRDFLKLYLKDPVTTRRVLYAKGSDGYQFKRAHAVAYAMVVKLQLFLIQTGIL